MHAIVRYREVSLLPIVRYRLLSTVTIKVWGNVSWTHDVMLPDRVALPLQKHYACLGISDRVKKACDCGVFLCV